MPTLLRSALLLALLAPVQAFAQQNDVPNYAVTTSGDTLRTAVAFKDPSFGTSYVEVDGRRREIERFSVLHIDGLTHAVVDGRRLAPLVIDGPVRFYARTVSSAAMIPAGHGAAGPAMAQPPGVGGVSRQIGYVQVENGPVLRATDGALRAALGENGESLRYLDRARTLRAAGWGATGLGLAAFLTGAVLSMQAEESGSTPAYAPVMVGGAAVAAVGGYLLPDMARSMRDRAIGAYNDSAE